MWENRILGHQTREPSSKGLFINRAGAKVDTTRIVEAYDVRTPGIDVTAASEWGGPAERKIVRPALNGSVEELFHEVGTPEFLISPLISRAAAEPLDAVRLGRAIGVIYVPATERQSHYYHVRPRDQFDAIIHIDRTTALEPLEVTSMWVAGETPETYPSGL